MYLSQTTDPFGWYKDQSEFKVFIFDSKEGVCSISAIFLFKHSLRFSVSENELKVIRWAIFQRIRMFLLSLPVHTPMVSVWNDLASFSSYHIHTPEINHQYDEYKYVTVWKRSDLINQRFAEQMRHLENNDQSHVYRCRSFQSPVFRKWTLLLN